MPTGYTEMLTKGDVSFKDFALRCARAFGALYFMRDEPLDAPIPDREKVEPSSYHLDSMKASQEDFSRFLSMTEQELEDAFNAYKKERKAAAQARLDEKLALKKRYEEKLQQTQEWVPPTSEHASLKNFMIQQLTNSISWDCDTQGAEEEMATIDNMALADWYEKREEDFQWDIDYHRKAYEKEYERVNKNILWVEQLKESLK